MQLGACGGGSELRDNGFAMQRAGQQLYHGVVSALRPIILLAGVQCAEFISTPA